ncbi:MAG: hypothetical protein V1779_12935 [bacterium]
MGNIFLQTADGKKEERKAHPSTSSSFDKLRMTGDDFTSNTPNV